MGVGELQDKKKENVEASILVHRWYRDVIQRIHVYRWQQQGREGREGRREGREGRERRREGRREGREGREDRREGVPHQLELQQIEKILRIVSKRYCRGSMLRTMQNMSHMEHLNRLCLPLGATKSSMAKSSMST